MRTSLTVMLSAVAVAVLLASPASAKSHHRGYASPFYGAYGAYGPYGYSGRYNGFGGPYTPNIRRPSHDFQDGGGNKG